MNFFDLLKGGTVLRKKAKASKQPEPLGTQHQHSLFIDHYTPTITEEERSRAASTTDGKDETKRQAKVKVTGIESAPAPVTEFADSPHMEPWLWKTMLSLNYPSPTAIQSHTIPIIASGYDLIATAPTGSGKTLAFLLPIFNILDKPGKECCRALIVDPTRELAQQTVQEAEHFVSSCSRKFQIKLLDNHSPDSKRLDVAVSTPLRLIHYLETGALTLKHTRVLVLDEADKLLDLGFRPQLDRLLGFVKSEIESRRAAGSELPLQIAFLSATLSEPVAALAEAVMAAPVRVSIGQQLAACMDVSQKLLFCGREDGKLAAMRQLIREGGVRPPTLVFVQSKDRAIELCNELLFDGVMIDVIHSDRTRAERDRVVRAFREGKIWVLIATDLMARGLDFKGVEMVINYDLPTSAQNYIHRIGRTGRAGRKGEAITFFTEEDQPLMRPVVNVIRNSECEVPQWLIDALPGRARDKKTRQNPEFMLKAKRMRIDTTSGFDRSKISRKLQMKEMSKSKKERQA